MINKTPIATFLRDRGIPAGEAIFAAVILGDQGIDVTRVTATFLGVTADTDTVIAALDEAQVRAAARRAEREAVAV